MAGILLGLMASWLLWVQYPVIVSIGLDTSVFMTECTSNLRALGEATLAYAIRTMATFPILRVGMKPLCRTSRRSISLSAH